MKKITFLSLLVFLVFNTKFHAQCQATIQESTITADNSGGPFALILFSNNYSTITNLAVGDTYTITNTQEPPNYTVFMTIRDPSDNSVVQFGAAPLAFVATATDLEIHYFTDNTCNAGIFGVLAIFIVNDSTLSVEDNIVSKNIEIFPNPFSDKLKIISKDILDSVIIYDSYGRKVIVTEPSARTTEINLSHLKSNVYYILTSSGGKINTKKIIRI